MKKYWEKFVTEFKKVDWNRVGRYTGLALLYIPTVLLWVLFVLAFKGLCALGGRAMRWSFFGVSAWEE